MATARRRRDDRDDDDAARGEEEEEREAAEPAPIDVETMAALREADPGTRKFALLRIQRTHGNATVQRVMRELQSTDASREGRMQQIGNRAEEPVPSGRIDRAILYRAAMEAEVEQVPIGQKNEREIVQDDVNTVGQIFANYQAAMHMFEQTIGADPATESVPRAVVADFLENFTAKFFGDLLDIDLGAIPLLAEDVDAAVGAADEPAEDLKDERDVGAPTTVLKNLAIAERRRLSGEHRALISDQADMMQLATDRLSQIDPDRRNEQREDLARIKARLDELELGTHSAEWLFRQILDAWKDELRDTSVVEVTLDERWNVRRAHIRGRNGRQLASELLADHSGVFDLNDLKLTRRLVITPAELAEVHVELDARGRIRSLRGNQKALPHLEEIRDRLEKEGLPETRRLTGD